MPSKAPESALLAAAAECRDWCSPDAASNEGNSSVPRQSSQNHYFGQVIGRLEQVSRAMNPLLLYIAVSLVVLNLACVVNLIDWNNLSQPAAATTVASASSTSHSN